MVDYEEKNGSVVNFKCFLGDWGTAGREREGIEFFGGTPVYAGPNSFIGCDRDFFSFGRLTLELFVDEQGPSPKLLDKTYQFSVDVFVTSL